MFKNNSRRTYLSAIDSIACKFLLGLVILTVLEGSFPAFAEDFDRRIPDEYETSPGHGLALGNAAVAAQSGLAAVRINPALLGLEPTYSVGAGYNWPTAGRDFYSAGVVDSQSSKIAAGFVYQGFSEDYGEDLSIIDRDSPVIRRASVGLSIPLGGVLSMGLGGSFVEAMDLERWDQDQRIKGTSLNMGVAGLITPNLRFGAGVENLANNKVATYSPQVIRAGTALLLMNGDVTFQFDLKQRQRVLEYETGSESDFLAVSSSESDRSQMKEENDRYLDPERMALASVSAKVYDLIRLLGGYGQSIHGPERQSVSGGIALVNNGFSISYAASRPYLSESSAQQAVNAAFALSF